VTPAEPRRLEARPLLRDHPTAWRLSLILWCLGGLLFVALAIPTLKDVVQRVDDRVWRLAVDLQGHVAVTVVSVLDFVGSTWVTAPVMVVTALYLAYRKRWEGFAFWIMAMVVSQLLIGPVKAIYERPRPPLPLVETSNFSFPSGHAVAGAAIAVSLVIVLVPASAERRNLEVLAGVFAMIMGLSRVYLRAHWLSDVVAGASLGAAVAIGSAVVVHVIDERRSARDRSR
jgi:membrane-associated phospholipid phosphatase